MSNADSITAKKNKNDEFYTQLVDIENELKHYKEHGLIKDKDGTINGKATYVRILIKSLR